MISTLTRRAGLATASLLAVSAVAAGVAPSATAGEHHHHGDHAGLQVSKTVTPSWTRTYSWRITKTATPAKTVIWKGRTATIGYAATLTASTSDAYSVSGNITITNPSHFRGAVVKSVTDVVSPGIAATVTCPVTLPAAVGAGKTLTCTYKAALPDATARTNTATVTSMEGHRTRTSTATMAVAFPSAPTNLVDECVAVSDTVALRHGQAGTKSLGTVCASDLTNGSKTISYSRTFGPFWRPGAFRITNTASFVTNDTQAKGSASATTMVFVPGRHHHHHHFEHHHFEHHQR